MAPPALRASVLKRDKYTCQFCGFQSRRFQEVRSADLDHNAPNPKNADEWITTCHICEQCLSLERVGMMGEGILIWLPEISQVDLNLLVRALYVARQSDGPLATTAKKTLDMLRARREEAKRRLGTDDPLILATVFFDHVSVGEYQERIDKMKDIRLLSLDRRIQKTANGEVDRFPEMVEFWASREGPYGQMPPGDWLGVLDQFDTGGR